MGAKKIWVDLALLVTGGALASCGGMGSVTSPGGDADTETEVRRVDDTVTDTDSTRSEPRGFQFESGFLEFGEFDPYTLGDDIFNPCTEITEEEFAEAGFEGLNYGSDSDTVGNRRVRMCHFEVSSTNAVVGGFYGGITNDRQELSEGELVMTKHESAIIPELYAVAPKKREHATCFCQIDTVRGVFGTSVTGPSGRISQDQACALAINHAERLYGHYGAV